MIGYLATAAALGAGWFVMLLVPSATRQWLLEGHRIGLHLALLAATSVVVAAAFRRAIARARSFGDHLALATMLPLAGCAIYLTLWNAWSLGYDALRGHVPNLHDAAVLYVWGLGSAIVSFYVVVPYGLLCQYVLKRLLDRG